MCDWWHGFGHSDNCPCNPWEVEELNHRICDVNTSIAEQVFSWFRRYASTLNELRPLRHRFICLLFAAMHNDALGRDEARYINFHSFVHKPPKKVDSHYGCSPAAKAKGKAAAKKKSTLQKFRKKKADERMRVEM